MKDALEMMRTVREREDRLQREKDALITRESLALEGQVNFSLGEKIEWFFIKRRLKRDFHTYYSKDTDSYGFMTSLPYWKKQVMINYAIHYFNQLGYLEVRAYQIGYDCPWNFHGKLPKTVAEQVLFSKKGS